MKKILNVSEMKQVRGGAQASSLCGEGEQLYTCSTSWMSGTVTQGSVCAKSASAAHAAVATSRAMAKTSLNLAYHAQFVK